MNKKKLDVQAITNELEGGASLFFKKPVISPSKLEPTASVDTTAHADLEKQVVAPSLPTSSPQTQAIKTDSKLSRYHAIKQAGYHDSIIELIRKAVRFAGKDAFFGRFTPEEKAMLSDIVYTYKRSGVKTSENEIARIAVNFIVNDYKENGENSLVDKVLKALNG